MKAAGIRCARKTRQTWWMAHVLCAFILTLCLAVPALAGKKRTFQKKKPFFKNRHPSAENFLASEMLRHLGVRYLRGGSSQGGVDCSGFVRLVYQNACGLTLPHQSASLYLSSDLQEIPSDRLKTGDLLFFTSSTRSKLINHVGMYLSEGRFVHSAIRKGVIISSLDEPYYSQRFAGARRVPGQKEWRNGSGKSIGLSAPDASLMIFFLYQGLEADSHSLSLEFGESRDFQVSLFRDSVLPVNAMGLGYSLNDDSTGVEHASLARVQGIIFEKDIRVLPWLVATPSISYFDYEGDFDQTGLPRRSAGLDLSLGSREDESSISTGFRYRSLIAPKGYVEEVSAPKEIDMLLSYRRRLSDTLSVYFIGERLRRYETTTPELIGQKGIFEDRRLSIIFNISY